MDEAPSNRWPWILNSTWPILLVLFAAGYDAIDRPEPDTGAGATWYVATAFVGAALIAVAASYRGSVEWPSFAFGGALAVLLGATMMGLTADSYNEGGVGFMFALVLFPAIIVGFGLTLLLQWLGRPDWSLLQSCTIWGTGLAGGFSLLAIYHLSTLNQQAVRAREAHESSLFAVTAFVALAAAMVIQRRAK